MRISLGETALFVVPPIIVALACMALAFPDIEYLIVAIALIAMILPGWLLAGLYFEETRPGPVQFWHAAAFFAIVLYAFVAFLCRTLGLGFDAFYIAWLVIAIFAYGARLKWGGTITPVIKSRHMSRNAVNILLFLSIVSLCVLLYRWPWQNDQHAYWLNVIGTFLNRDFQPSMLDQLSYGLTEGNPRAVPNLFHTMFSLLADATDISPNALVDYAAVPFFGALMILAMISTVHTICGGAVSMPFAIFAVFSPLTVLNLYPRHFNNFDFVFLNSPTIDKNFAVYFVLPSAIAFVYRFIKSGRYRDISPVILAFPALTNFHPSVPYYFFILSVVLLVGLRYGDKKKIIPIVMATAVSLLLVTQFGFNFGSGNQGFQKLIEIDGEKYIHGDNYEGSHFWSGHYATPGLSRDSSVSWIDGEIAYLKTRTYLKNNLIVGSACFFVIWFWYHFFGSHRLGVARRWSIYGRTREAEALNLQIAMLLAIIAAYFAGSLIINLALWTFRGGIERLHWFYLGFISAAFVSMHTYRLLASVLTEKWRLTKAPLSIRAKRHLILAPALLMGLHLLDQSLALYLDHRSLTARLPILESVTTKYFQKPENAQTSRRLNAGKPADYWIRTPSWLKPEDSILVLEKYPGQYSYAVTEKSVFHFDVASVGYGYANGGDFFLQQYFAFIDLMDGRINDPALEWIDNRDVTIIISTNAELRDALARKFGWSFTNLEGHIWRVVR